VAKWKSIQAGFLEDTLKKFHLCHTWRKGEAEQILWLSVSLDDRTASKQNMRLLPTFLDQMPFQALLILVRRTAMITFELIVWANHWSCSYIIKNYINSNYFLVLKCKIPKPSDASWEGSTWWISIRWSFRLGLRVHRTSHRGQGKDASTPHLAKWLAKLDLSLYVSPHRSHL